MEVLGPVNINQRMGNTDSKQNTVKTLRCNNTLETYGQLCSLQ